MDKMPIKWEIRKHSKLGRSLFADNGMMEVGIPLGYGLRIGYLAFCGGENVFFEQPSDMKDLTTEAGWCIRGGHRLWIAPESNKVYYPDNEPVDYEIHGEEAVLWQKEDPWIGVVKSMRISFKENDSLRVVHSIRNVGNAKLNCSLWAISAMAPGGVQHIPLEVWNGGSAPRNWISTWYYTNLGDCRAVYTKEEIQLTHMPMEEKYKIGVGRPLGVVWYENNGVIFEKSFAVEKERNYPDREAVYETFMCKHMVEMESLSPYGEILPGEMMEHEEVWRLRKAET